MKKVYWDTGQKAKHIDFSPTPLYSPPIPSHFMVFTKQSKSPLYTGLSTGCVWRRTLMVSNGWPTRQTAIPLNVPETKFFTVLLTNDCSPAGIASQLSLFLIPEFAMLIRHVTNEIVLLNQVTSRRVYLFVEGSGSGVSCRGRYLFFPFFFFFFLINKEKLNQI